MLENKIKIIQRNTLIDERGWFLKIINGKEDDLPNFTGESYITVAYPGKFKGGHYHNIANEWFTLIKGECILEIIDIKTKEFLSINLNDNNHITIYIPSAIAHRFVNDSSKEFILHAYTDLLYDPKDTVLYEF